MRRTGLMMVLVFLSTLSYAEIGKIKVSGSLETQSRSLNNSSDLANYSGGANDDSISDTQSRLLIGLEAPLAEDVSGSVVLSKNNRMYGQASESALTVENSLVLENAYLTIDNFLDIFKVKLGRQFVGEKGDLSLYVGPTKDDLLSVNALDGLDAETSIGACDVTLLNFKSTESGATTANANSNQDKSLSGLVVKNDSLADGLDLGVYAYQQIDRSGGMKQFDRDDLRIYGIKAAKSDLGVEGLGVKAEYAMNAGMYNMTGGAGGAKQTYAGSAMVVGASYKASDSLNAGLEYASGSGNDTTSADNEAFTAISSDLRYGEIWANSLGNAGIQNTTVIKAGVGYKPSFSDKLSANLSYLTLTQTEVAAGAKDDLGSEVDLRIGWKQSEAVGLELVAAQLMPGDVLKAAMGAAKKDAISKIAANLKVSF